MPKLPDKPLILRNLDYGESPFSNLKKYKSIREFLDKKKKEFEERKKDHVRLAQLLEIMEKTCGN